LLDHPPYLVKNLGLIAKDRVRALEEERKKPIKSKIAKCTIFNGLHHNVAICIG